MPGTRLLKVILLGDGGVGKSSLMTRFVHQHFEEKSYHTIGIEFLDHELVVDGTKYTLQIWDTAGQERFRSLRTPFYRGSDICLLVYAVDDASSFAALELWKREFFHYANVNDVQRFPFVVIGNKCDLSEEQRQITLKDAQTWAKEHGDMQVLESSAKMATNVNESFCHAVRAWQGMESEVNERMGNIKTPDDVVDLQRLHSQSRSEGCCTTIK